MHIFFVDGSSDRGQYALLEQERVDATLASYAYKGTIETLWAKAWEKQYQAGIKSRVIIDCGAFTAYTCGKPVNLKEYGEWALNLRSQWSGKLHSMSFMNLDEIGDQEKSWKNQEALDAMGLRPMPILAYQVEKKHFERALEYPYIALGSLILIKRDRAKMKAWLDYCFSIFTQHYKKTGKMPKVHILGVTTEWVLERYPCYSSDSSTWIRVLRFGETNHLDNYMPKVPPCNQSDAALSANLHGLRGGIRKFKKMERDMTKLWQHRGITWND